MPFGDLDEIGIFNGRQLHQIDGPTEDLFQIELQPHVSLERSLPAGIRELDEEIQVAVGGIEVVSRSRAEQFQPPDAMLYAQRPNLRFMLFD